MCNESVERSTERHHASITTGDVKRDAAEQFLRDDYRHALVKLPLGEVGTVWTPGLAYLRFQPVTEAAVDGSDALPEDGRAMLAELLAIAYALSCASDELETRDVRAKAVALITRMEDEHVSTHLNAAVEGS